MTDQPTTSEKLKKIYETMSDKTLSPGCIYNQYQHGDDHQVENLVGKNWVYIGNELIDNIEIIGHPVMIGDVLDWIENKFDVDFGFPLDIEGEERLRKNLSTQILYSWEKKRRSIEDNQEAIDFIYGLIQDDRPTMND